MLKTLTGLILFAAVAPAAAGPAELDCIIADDSSAYDGGHGGAGGLFFGAGGRGGDG